MKHLRASFKELHAEGEHHTNDFPEGYPYDAVVVIAADVDETLRYLFIRELRAGLEGTDYRFHAGCEGRLCFSFRTASDRQLLYDTRESDLFDYKVRKGMENPRL